MNLLQKTERNLIVVLSGLGWGGLNNYLNSPLGDILKSEISKDWLGVQIQRKQHKTQVLENYSISFLINIQMSRAIDDCEYFRYDNYWPVDWI